MLELSTFIKEKYPDLVKKIEKAEEDHNAKLSKDLDLAVDDLVQFRKKDLSKVQIIGKILSINKNTYHVKTFCSFKSINEFYLDISEIRKYDPT